MKLPLIFDIKRGSIDDGSGIRTVIFLKGCPLNCSWCHNPEAISCEGEYLYDKSRCIKCDKCFDLCPTKALKHVGKEYEISEIISIIAEDKAYYKVSGGGVTFSGGEPTFHMEYLSVLAREINKIGISCALETCGYFNYSEFKKLVLPYLDLVLFDVKLIDFDEHKKYTGVGNDVILDNLRLLNKENVKIIPRTPLIPEITDTDENINGITNFLSELGLEDRYVKLPYNNLGCHKKEMMKDAKKLYSKRSQISLNKIKNDDSCHHS